MQFWRQIQSNLLLSLHITLEWSYPGMSLTLSALLLGVKTLKRFDGNIVTYIYN